MRTFELSHIELDNDYRKKWNIGNLNDFVHLTRNGQLINNTLYRKGGLGKINTKNDYFLLLKHTEDYYEDSDYNKGDINKKRHLRSNWCIIDKDGNEKIVFNNNTLDYPYLSGGLIYSIGHKYYNIETGYFYCHSYHSLDSDNFLFLDNKFDEDKSKQGIMKINKNDGSWELFQ